MQKDSSRWSVLFLLFSILFGAIVRFAPTIISGTPINDGGMFAVMISDLRANRFLIPAFTSYNNLDIPFAYPPLSFYVGGLLSALGVSPLEILRWLPPFISTLSIPAFYWMASLMLDSKTKAALAALAYALMPRTFSWYVMGGGLSRTFGVLFLLLASASAWALFTKPASKYIFLTALFGAGAVLSHPETGLHAAAAGALIWLFKGRSARSLRDALLVVAGVFLLTSPWWVIVLAQHGLAPFQSALNTGGYDRLFWLPLLTFDFSEERFVAWIAALGLLGFTVQCLRRHWFLPAWLLMPFVVEPRSGSAIAAIPLAMLAGVGLSELVIPNIAALASRSRSEAQDWTVYMPQHAAVRIVLGYFMFSALAGAFIYDLSLANYFVAIESREAMEWAGRNTPLDSRFLVLTGRPDPFSDPSAEWFPAFAGRTSQNTIQGREWLLGENFILFRDGLENLQNCLNASPACLDDWASKNRLDFDFVYLEKSKRAPAALLIELRRDPNYTLVFENAGAAIFARK